MEERLKYLFRRYIENICTREELEEFFAYTQEAKNDEELRGLIKKVYETIRENSSLTYVDEGGNLILTKPGWLAQPVARKRSLRKKLAICVLIVAGIIGAGGIWYSITSIKSDKDLSRSAPLKK